MVHYRGLYKDSSLLCPRIEKNRAYLKAERERKRNKQFLNNRNLNIIPTPNKLGNDIIEEPHLTSTPLPIKKPVIETIEENNKENITENVAVVSPCIAKVACAEDKIAVRSSKEAYLQRFMEWRAKKKKEAQRKQELKKASTVVSEATATTASVCASFAPKDCKFKAPLGLKQPQVEKHDTVNTEESKRKSLYMLVPTPQKKTKKQDVPTLGRRVLQNTQNKNDENKIVAAKPKISLSKATLASKPLTASTNKSKVSPIAVSATKMKLTPSINSKFNNQLNKPLAVSTVAKTNTVKASITKVAPVVNLNAVSNQHVNNIPQITEIIQTSTTKKPANLLTQPFVNTKLNVPQVNKFCRMTLKKQQRHEVNCISSKPALIQPKISKPMPKLNAINGEQKRVVSATGKAQIALNNKLTATQNKNPYKNANLVRNMKSKRINIKVHIKRPAPIKDKLHVTLNEVLAKTPTDINTENPFGNFITSTKRKSHENINGFLNVTDISPVEYNDGLSVKRDKQKMDITETKDLFELQAKPKSKFNFVRYSVTNTDVDPILSPKQSLKELENVKVNNVVQRDTDIGGGCVNSDKNCTPPPADEQRPANYVSPYVSISRGKVNAKVERQKRDSMYLIDEGNTTKHATFSEINPADPTLIKNRRTLESVHYFRQQLQNETKRLKNICNQWDLYKTENLKRLQDLNCDDKIDVAIGQTMLLTSNKFEQFNGLIKRCETGATGIGAMEYDGSEDTKAVQAEDLEGFWAMLGLQIENVEKRFAELERWKSNEWLDPDAEHLQQKVKKIKKPKKKIDTKTKISSGLLEFKLKKYAEMNKMREAASNDDNNSNSSISAGGSGSSISTTGTSTRRISVVVPNRKQFSPARIILGLPESSKQSAFIPRVTDRYELRKTAILGAQENGRKRSLNATTTTPPTKLRKSILKTPGSATQISKNVIFSNKKQIRKFNFVTYEKANESGNYEKHDIEDFEADMTQSDPSIKMLDRTKSIESNKNTENKDNSRTYSLRTRKIKLRPSSEILIPRH